LLLLVALFTTSPLLPLGAKLSPFLTFPFVIWLALRGRAASAPWAVMLVATAATWSAMEGAPAFLGPDGALNLGQLWALIATLGSASLLVVAMRNENQHVLKVAQASEARMRGLIDASPVPFALNTDQQEISYFNPAFTSTFGYTLADAPTLDDWWLLAYPDPAYRERVTTTWWKKMELAKSTTSTFEPMEVDIRCKDGSVRTALVGAALLANSFHDSHLVTLYDITDRRVAERRLRVLAGAFQHSGEAILVTNELRRIVEVNAAFERMTGYAAEEVLGKDPSFLASGRTTAEEYAQMQQGLAEANFWKGELWDRHKDGHIFPVLVTLATIRDDSNAVRHYVASYTDITERKAYEERISYLAHHDALTKLPNRFSLQDRLEQALATARRDHTRLAVLLIDLDNFKTINDTLGHNIGDGILVEVARRLRESVRDSDIVARLGGDEFVVALTESGSGAVPVLAAKLLHALARPYVIDGYDLNSTPSIGISVYPEDGDSAESLIKSSDVAMYHAKSNGRNNFQFFTPAMNVAATERLNIENSLRLGLERHQFLLHYQPQVDVTSGQVVGVEALVRWQHPQFGMVVPDRFIPIAEETGLILPLGAWVLEAAVEQLAAWESQGLRGLRMAINLSARQLRDNGLLPVIEAVLGRYGVRAEQIELEITESAAMENAERTAAILLQLRAMGVGLAIDDFGTGYSSLSYLKRLPVGTLKIDRSFVMDIERDENDAAICTATISLAHSLGLSVVAEGVETAAQLEYLKKLGCDLAQGYYFSKPMPAEECTAFIRKQS
jgi:diguanylate cyclase (GGDEF)-like protein/PAS domain S-box-containing protein